MQIYETSFGSMKRGLAMLEVWNMKVVFVLLFIGLG